MKNIGELVKVMVAEREERDPGGGLVNGPHKACTCGRPCCGHMPTDPHGKRPGA